MSFLSRRLNLNTLRKHRSGKGLSPKLRRRMLLESLEGRAMMAADVGHQDAEWVTAVNTYIPAPQYVTTPGGFLSAPTAGNKTAIGMNYLKSNAAQFGLTSNDFNFSRISNNYVSQHNGVTHLYLQQMFDGLPVQGAVASVSVTSSGQVISAASSFIPGLQHPATPGPITAGFEANDALEIFAQASGYAAEGAWTSIDVNSNERERYSLLNVGAADPIQVKAELHYVPVRGGGVELAWHLTHIYTFDGEHAYDISVGLDSRQLLRVGDWVADATYNVIPLPAESPDEAGQALVVDPQYLPASPFGWHDTNGVAGPDTQNTTGNNVFAQEDANANDTGGVQPTGGAGLVFNYPFNPAQAPNAYVNAAIVNLFYVNNVIHDVFWNYGFDEVSGNFQQTNYSGQGLGGDALRADAQDGSGTNNANMLTPPDGTPPRMQQFIFTITNPDRDSSLENGIIIHEFTHGISNRLTGGPADALALQNLQSQGMGEGWSDFFALWMTQVPSETSATPRPMGNYVLGQPASGGGVRRFPYSVDMSIDPLTLGNFNGGFPNNEVHNSGEIWASVLWDLNWAMINKYGYSTDLYTGTAGNNLAMQLVMDGMKLQPANPSFLDARDAILAADQVNNGGANYTEIWATFARRGFGFSADDGGDSDSPTVTEAFDMPPPLPTVGGVVYIDANLNANRDVVDIPLGGITVYADANNNAVLDANEISTVSGADGTYVLKMGFGSTTVVVRQSIDPTKYQQTEPTNNGGYTVNVTGGGDFRGYDFGNKAQPGEIIGRKWHDINGDGIQDPGEPGMAGVYIYVDYNNNGKIGILEHAGVTDNNGFFRIINVNPGIWNVREVMAPGSTATFPVGDPLNGIPAGVHFGVEVRSSEVTRLIDFGNVTAIDWGDAPDSYGTLASSNGARHSILAGFGLGPAGLVVEHDPNGQPSAGADADALDDGVRPITAFTPGELARIAVRATTGGRAAGFLQGWMDFNHNGVFEASEKIVSDFRLAGSAVETQIEFRVPATAQLGATFARFRYGYEVGAQSSPVGPASVGEVEDYLFDFRPEDPVAVIDGPFTVRQNSNGATNPANQFDILANDLGSTADDGAQPRFGGFVTSTGEVPAGVPARTQNGTVVFNSTTGLAEYTPDLGFIGDDYFEYFVVDSFGTRSEPVRVDIFVASNDPLALDDTFRVNVNSSFPTGTGAHPNRFNVLANDFPPTGIFIGSVRNFDGTPANPAEIRISADSQTIEYQPATGFQGTRQFIYTISDNDPVTTDRSAILTVQVSPTTPNPANYDVQLSLRLINEAGILGGPINVGETFTVEAYARDLRNVGTAIAGVEAAYMDVLFDDTKARLLRTDELGPGEQAIEFSDNYSIDTNGANNVPGIINEVGGANNESETGGPHGPGDVLVFTVRFRATGAGDIQFVADPADPGDLGDRTAILVTDIDASDDEDNPDVVPDTRVFLVASQTVTIGSGAGGEGEYTNSSNRLDVNSDNHVTPLDALIIINELNSNGPRDLTQLWNPAAGPLPSSYVDVNLDGHTTALDALHIINWLNANPVNLTSFGGEGEGEGEAFSGPGLASTSHSADTSSNGGLAVCPPVPSPLETEVQAEGEASDDFVPPVVAPAAAKSNTSTVSSSDDESAAPIYSNLNSAVVDLLFAEEEEEVVTGSNGSDDRDASETSDELLGQI